MVTGPQETAQFLDARKVVAYMLNHLDETYAEEVSEKLYFTPEVADQPFNPLNYLYWTPNNETKAIATALTQGVIPKYLMFSLIQMGYDWPHAADAFNQILAPYGNALRNIAETDMPTELCGPNGSLLAYTEVLAYVNRDGSVGGEEQNEPQVQIGNQPVYVPFDATMALQEGAAIISVYPPGTPGFPQPKTWKELLFNQIVNPPGSGPPSMGHQYAGVGIGFHHLVEAYNFAYGDQNDAKGFFLDQIDTSFLDRYQTVPIEAALIAKKAQSFAVQNKIAYSSWNYIARVPLTVQDLRVLRLSNVRYVGREFPTRLATWLHVGYNGMMPIIPTPADATPANPYTAWYTPDFNGKPNLALIMSNPAYQEAWESLWRAAIAYYACIGGNKSLLFSLDPSGALSEWGTLLKLTLNPDQSPALPYSDTNADYSDCTKFSDIQNANAFTTVAADFVLAPLLGLTSGVNGAKNSQSSSAPLFNQDVYNDFLAQSPNNQVMLKAWLRVDPKLLLTFNFTTTLVTIPPPPPLDNIDEGPYGELNPQTA